LLAIAFWYIWEARNTVRNGETENHPSYWVDKILTYADMFLLHGKRSLYSNRCKFTRSKFWTPPPEDWIMINVDADVFEAKNRMGIGLVARNHKGDFWLQSDKELIKLSTLS
jgi:hypothetical protein